MTRAACPWCGAGVGAITPGDHVCGGCGRPFTDAGNVRAWRWHEASAPLRSFATLLARQFNPLSSRLSPLRLFSDWRVEQYYRRTLTDGAMARAGANHYLRELDLAPGAPVLDHGCGRGRNTALLGQLGYEVAAQDIAPHSWWQRLSPSQFQSVPVAAARLPWRDRSFALVVDVGVVHYLTEAQFAGLADEVFRVLAPGGYWLLLEGNDESYGAARMRQIIGHLHSLSTSRRVVKAAGFSELDLGYEGFYAPVLPLYVNFVRKLMRPGTVDLSDIRSWLADRIPKRRRACWLLRLRKPHE